MMPMRVASLTETVAGSRYRCHTRLVPSNPRLRPDQVASLQAFLTRYADFNREVVYDDSDVYCHAAVHYDPVRGLRRIISGPRENAIYNDSPLTPEEALELVRGRMEEHHWDFPG